MGIFSGMDCTLATAKESRQNGYKKNQPRLTGKQGAQMHWQSPPGPIVGNGGRVAGGLKIKIELKQTVDFTIIDKKLTRWLVQQLLV